MALLFQRKMACIEEVNFSVCVIAPECFCARRQKNRIIDRVLFDAKLVEEAVDHFREMIEAWFPADRPIVEASQPGFAESPRAVKIGELFPFVGL